MRTRATTSTGAVVDDPSAGDVRALMSEVEAAGNGAFVTVERGVHTFVQAVLRSGSFVVEILDGSRFRHALVADVPAGAAVAIVESWTAGTPDWRLALPWQRVA